MIMPPDQTRPCLFTSLAQTFLYQNTKGNLYSSCINISSHPSSLPLLFFCLIESLLYIQTSPEAQLCESTPLPPFSHTEGSSDLRTTPFPSFFFVVRSAPSPLSGAPATAFEGQLGTGNHGYVNLVSAHLLAPFTKSQAAQYPNESRG